ncbi:hypothetical protein G9A89_012976 [Geosiphon pyriformis]|nr:hypothetical protein G9A89_012976 [Geosiphon pyriformis]
MSTQFPVFTVSLVVENALEKNCKLWLVLQNMCKAYDSVGWHYLEANLKCIKMCSKFISFFRGIHNDKINRVITDFGLSNGYRVHNGLDQGEVKRHKHLCGYRIDTNFVAKTGRIKNSGGMLSFFAAGAFVDDMIWVGDCQTSMQYALNIASEFFSINDISINNEKIVGVKVASLSISGQPISIAKKSEAYKYLKIFLSTERLSKSSLAKAYSDPIVSYRMQFSFVSSGVYCKWDILVRKGLRSKACLSHDFPNKTLHHLFLYGLKFFDQVQSESKMAVVISFSNALGILGWLFLHCFLDLQVLGWTFLNLLQFPVKLLISPVNNFLAGVVKIFLDCELSLVGFLPSAFRNSGNFFMSEILGKSLFFSCACSLKCFGIAFGNRLLEKKTFCHWKRLDLRSPVLHWFNVTSRFLLNRSSVPPAAVKAGGFSGCSILDSEQFAFVYNSLLEVWSGSFDVYIDGLLKFAGSPSVINGAAAYFLALDSGVGIGVHGLLSSTLSKLQAVAFALKCVPPSYAVVLHLNSQAAINACVSELAFAVPDFCNYYWIERKYIANLIKDKDLAVNWVKVKSYFEVSGNDRTDMLAGEAAGSSFSLLAGICECFLVPESTAILGNPYHFVRDVYRSICHAHWETGPSHNVVLVASLQSFNWIASAQVWHPDLHMLAGFTSHKSVILHIYLIKALHRRLPVAVRKKLYDKSYPSMQCLLCNVYIQGNILLEVTLDLCHSDVSLYSVMCKRFVLKDWCTEVVGIFGDVKNATSVVVDFRAGLVGDDGLVVGLSCCGSFMLSDGVVRLLGIIESFTESFSYCRPCFFFSGLDSNLHIVLSV